MRFDLQAQIAQIKTEVMAVLSATDLSVSQFLEGSLFDGEFDKRALFAARHALHMQAVKLLETADKIASMETP